MKSKRNILITGATGFVGSNLARRLSRLNYKIHILKRKDSDIWRIKDIISKLHVHEGDLLKQDFLSKTLKKINPSIIFHLANLGLYSRVDPSLENSMEVNVLGTINLINSAENIEYEYFINTGSSSEYGLKDISMKETDLCEPLSNYALSKLTATLYAQSYAKRTKKPLVTLRIFSPFGPYDSPNRLITYSILKMLRNEDIIVHKPNAVRDYIFIEDIIDAYLLCMKIPSRLTGEIFNIGSGKQTTIKDIVRLIMKQTNSKSKIIWGNSSKENARIWEANIQKAKKNIGWSPQKTLIQGLQETVTWFEKNSYLYA